MQHVLFAFTSIYNCESVICTYRTVLKQYVWKKRLETNHELVEYRDLYAKKREDEKRGGYHVDSETSKSVKNIKKNYDWRIEVGCRRR